MRWRIQRSNTWIKIDLEKRRKPSSFLRTKWFIPQDVITATVGFGVTLEPGKLWSYWSSICRTGTCCGQRLCLWCTVRYVEGVLREFYRFHWFFRQILSSKLFKAKKKNIIAELLCGFRISSPQGIIKNWCFNKTVWLEWGKRPKTICLLEVSRKFCSNKTLFTWCLSPVIRCSSYIFITLVAPVY